MTMGPQPGAPPVSLINGQPDPGVLGGSWQSPMSDPSAAYRNFLRSRGQLGNILSPRYAAMVDQAGMAAWAQFLSNMQEASSAGLLDNTNDLQGEFAKFLESGGASAQMTPTIGQASAKVQQMTQWMEDLQRRVVMNQQGQTPRNAQEWSAALDKMQASGAMKVTDRALLGMMMDPRTQAEFHQNMYARQLGPALAQGLGKITGAQTQLYGDTLQPLVDERFGSLLGVLQGNYGGGNRIGPPNTPPMTGAPSGPSITPPPMSVPPPMSNGAGMSPPGGAMGPGGGGSLGGSSALPPNMAQPDMDSPATQAAPPLFADTGINIPPQEGQPVGLNTMMRSAAFGPRNQQAFQNQQEAAQSQRPTRPLDFRMLLRLLGLPGGS